MKILSYVKSLLPRMGKDQVLEDLRNTSTELDDVVAPSYRNASEFFRSNKFQSDPAKDLEAAFQRKFDRNGQSKQPNFISEINFRVPFLRENVAFIEEQIEALFEREIYAEGLSARKAILLRAAEHLSFISRMSADILNYVYTSEAQAVGSDAFDGSELSPAEKRHVEINIGNFSQLLSDYGMPNKKFVDMIGTIPDIFVNSRSAASVAGAFDESDVDPFQANTLSNFVGNPIYHLRVIVTEWQASRYRANKDKKRMLELRLLHLEMLEAKKSDPKVEQEIEYTRNRVNKLDRALREVEESVEAEV